VSACAGFRQACQYNRGQHRPCAAVLHRLHAAPTGALALHAAVESIEIFMHNIRDSCQWHVPLLQPDSPAVPECRQVVATVAAVCCYLSIACQSWPHPHITTHQPDTDAFCCCSCCCPFPFPCCPQPRTTAASPPSRCRAPSWRPPRRSGGSPAPAWPRPVSTQLHPGVLYSSAHQHSGQALCYCIQHLSMGCMNLVTWTICIL
jgi:hypothetical protein